VAKKFFKGMMKKEDMGEGKKIMSVELRVNKDEKRCEE
jgi:hypothetical protein